MVCGLSRNQFIGAATTLSLFWEHLIAFFFLESILIWVFHILFARIRKGLHSEARVVSRILPQFLDDFFPPQDVMNKVIGEFLSNQQPYPQFMATVVYKVSSRT